MKQFFSVLLFFTAFAVFAGGRQDGELGKYLTEVENQLFLGKTFSDLQKIPGIQGLEPTSKGAVPNPSVPWIFTDVYKSRYRMTIYYRLDGQYVDSARIYFRSSKEADIQKMLDDAYLFLEYYGAYDEFYDEEGHLVFRGKDPTGKDRAGRIDWNQTSITLILDDKLARNFPNPKSQRLR
jgi:hypothetical protein